MRWLMIKTEIIDGRIRTYSDIGMHIRQNQTGILYEDALDFPELNRTYTETNIPIENEITAEEALNILLGGETM